MTPRHRLSRMDKQEYKELRRRIGTWKKVAELTGECWRTIARRESGETVITRAAELTILRLEPTWFAEMPPLPELEGEEIRHVPGWEGYAVTDRGRVLSCRSKYPFPEFPFEKWRELVPTKGHRGYWVVSLSAQGIRRQFKLHQLVLLVFVGPKPAGLHGCHFDDNKDHNWLVNLRWDTPAANQHDKVRNGRFPDRKGSRHPMARLTELEVEAIRRRRSEGETLRAIGDDFGVSEATVSLIYRGKTWKNSNNGKVNEIKEDDASTQDGALP
jgi:hypothetical protein